MKLGEIFQPRENCIAGKSCLIDGFGYISLYGLAMDSRVCRDKAIMSIRDTRKLYRTIQEMKAAYRLANMNKSCHLYTRLYHVTGPRRARSNNLGADLIFKMNSIGEYQYLKICSDLGLEKITLRMELATD